MPKATKDARTSRRHAGPSDENDGRAANGHARDDESYAWSRRAPANAGAFMTPDQQQSQQRRDFDWHYQETPPAQIQQSRQPRAAYRDTAAAYIDSGEGDDDEDTANGFKTPEPEARRPSAANANQSMAHTSDGEQQFQSAAEFAQSQYRRRNRLEKRLEELQKDVASLTLKLRSSSNRSNSTIAPPSQAPLSEIPLHAERVNRPGDDRSPVQQTQRRAAKPPSPVVKVKKTRAVDKPRPRSNLSEHSTTPMKGRMASNVSVSTMRELHKVTTERDQLRFELEKTKRTLTSTEKRLDEATKAREALEKLRAHCESLQESLDLSEKIRVRQKKLLQQLQLNEQEQTHARQTQQQHRQTQQSRQRAEPSHGPKTREVSVERPAATRVKKKNPVSTAAQDATSRGYSSGLVQPEYDVLDSLVNNLPPSIVRVSSLENQQQQQLQQQRLSHRAAPAPTRRSTVHAGDARAHARAAPAQPQRTSGYTYADFDSLLQKVHSPHPYTMMAQPQRFSSAAAGGGDGQRLSRRDGMDASAAATRRIRSKSQGPPATRTRPTSAGSARTKRSGSSNHFLAPTQASLLRMQANLRRPDERRRPFI